MSHSFKTGTYCLLRDYGGEWLNIFFQTQRAPILTIKKCSHDWNLYIPQNVRFNFFAVNKSVPKTPKQTLYLLVIEIGKGKRDILQGLHHKPLWKKLFFLFNPLNSSLLSTFNLKKGQLSRGIWPYCPLQCLPFPSLVGFLLRRVNYLQLVFHLHYLGCSEKKLS